MLNIKGAGPIGGTLELGPRWSDLFDGIPSFVGAWSAETLPDGLVSDWMADYGSISLTQPDISRQPMVTSSGEEVMVKFDRTKLLNMSENFQNNQNVTICIRAYMADIATDAQGLFGQSNRFRGRYRSNNGQFEINNGLADIRSPISNNGWYNFVIVQGDNSLSMQINDQNPVSNANPDMGVNSLTFGATNRNDDTGNWTGGISKIAIANAALSGDDLEVFKRWISQ